MGIARWFTLNLMKCGSRARLFFESWSYRVIFSEGESAATVRRGTASRKRL